MPISPLITWHRKIGEVILLAVGRAAHRPEHFRCNCQSCYRIGPAHPRSRAVAVIVRSPTGRGGSPEGASPLYLPSWLPRAVARRRGGSRHRRGDAASRSCTSTLLLAAAHTWAAFCAAHCASYLSFKHSKVHCCNGCGRQVHCASDFEVSTFTDGLELRNGYLGSRVMLS